MDLVKSEVEKKKVITRASVGVNAEEYTVDEVKQLIKTGDINKKLVKDLKNMCATLKIHSEGKKQDLIDRIKSKFMN